MPCKTPGSCQWCEMSGVRRDGVAYNCTAESKKKAHKLVDRWAHFRGSKSRRFNPTHFAEWKWLHWCVKVFCQVCHNVKALKFNMLARCMDDAFTTTGFNDRKHATACYRKHEESSAHIESVMKWNQHMKGVSVDSQLSTKNQKQQAVNRSALEKIVATLQRRCCL